MQDIEYIVKKYSNLIYKICYDMTLNSQDANDLSQETFISYYTHINSYEKLPEDEIKNIICKIALNKCKDYLKSKIKKQMLITDINTEALEKYKFENDIEEKIYNKKRKELIINDINLLNEPYKTVIYEYYINEKSLNEISKKYSRTNGTVKMQLHRGREKLKEIINKKGGVSYYE